MFQNLRQGNQIYILEKGEKPSLKIGQVLKVGSPTAVYNTQTTGIMNGFQPKMEIVVRANVDGTEGDFAHLYTDESVHDYGNMVVTDSREAMLSEVDSLKQKSQQEIDRLEYNKSVVASCGEIFKVLNPRYAKEQERDEAIKDLNSRFDNFEKRMGTTLSNIEKLLSKGTKS